METRNRCAYPDSPNPGHRHLIDWITKPYSIVFTAVVLFILIFGIAIFLGWRQFETTRHNALMADRTTANLLADLILEHNKATIGILQSYAYRFTFIDAVKNKDVAGAYRHLSDLKKNAEIDLTFVTDTRGILWMNFPVFPEAIGKDLSQRDWYKGLSSHWKPYISTVFKLIVGDKLLAVAVCVPIFDEKGKPIGILGNSQRLSFLDEAIKRVPLSPYTAVNVIDRAGQILYSNKVPYQENITNYRFIPIIEPAMKGKKQQIEINDPQKDQEKSYLSVVPVGDIGWTVIIERSLRDIYRSDLRSFIEIGASSFLLFLLIIFFLVYLRKATLFRKTEELLHAETKLRQGDEKLRALSSRQEAFLAAVPEIIMEVDNNKVYTWANSVGIEFFGEDVIGKEAAFYFEGEQETYDTVSPLFNGAKDIIYVESWQRRRDGQKRLLAWWCRVLKDEKGNVEGALSSAYDITERKKAEAELRDAETRYHLLFEHSPDGIVIVDPATARPLEFNETAHRQLGYSREEFARLSISDLDALETPEETKAQIANVIREGRKDFETLHRTRQGEIRNIQVTAQITEILGHPVYHCIWRDITDRKQAEDALRKSEEKFRLLIENAPDAIYVHADARFIYLNHAAVNLFGAETADQLIGSSIMDRYDPDYHGVITKRLHDLYEERKKLPIFEQVYLRLDGSSVPVEAHAVPITYNDKNAALTFVRDITERKKAEEQLRESLEQLRRAMQTTIQVLLMAVEMKDPYTAGHQRRMTNLARTMATEMGLPPEKIEGLRMAGVIHDIGKITLPTEILSKPTKLSAIELSLIREHVRLGYGILKDVESPWPLAEIVLQHHERMDGSGYPRGLKGEEILIEARILAVADVVEAMASHRPYRPALGIDAALEEIEKNRGLLYDSHAVDTCLRVFREKGYQIEGT